MKNDPLRCIECPIDIEDREAQHEAVREGYAVLTTKIEKEITERHSSCLGTIVLDGQVECGVLHGNTSDKNMIEA